MINEEYSKDTPIIPIIESGNIYLRARGHTDDERFATIFRDTWRKLPPEVCTAIVLDGEGGQKFETYETGGPSPYIACELDWDDRGDTIGMWSHNRGSLRFWAPIVTIMPDEIVSVLIAHEICHGYRATLGLGFDQRAEAVIADEKETRAMVAQWGFQEEALNYWLFLNGRRIKRLEQIVSQDLWAERRKYYRP